MDIYAFYGCKSRKIGQNIAFNLPDDKLNTYRKGLTCLMGNGKGQIYENKEYRKDLYVQGGAGWE